MLTIHSNGLFEPLFRQQPSSKCLWFLHKERRKINRNGKLVMCACLIWRKACKACIWVRLSACWYDGMSKRHLSIYPSPFFFFVFSLHPSHDYCSSSQIVSLFDGWPLVRIVTMSQRQDLVCVGRLSMGEPVPFSKTFGKHPS